MVVTGKPVGWCGGALSGDQELLSAIRGNATARMTVDYRRASLTANLETILGAVAAITAVDPHTALIVDAPQEVHDHISTFDCQDVD